MLSSHLNRWYSKSTNQLHPGQLICISYLLAITVGTFLLSLPMATTSGSIDFIDALFTSTSAVCVTGLAILDTGTQFTGFGQGVILALVQLGGIGIMTFSVTFFRLLGKQVSFRERLALQETFSHTPSNAIYKILASVFLFTIVAELVGAILLLCHWLPLYPWQEALWFSIFHSITAFCNAGFSLHETSFINYRSDWLPNTAVCLLTLLGGIGFPVIHDLYYRYCVRDGKRRKLLVQTKVILLISIILVTGGAVLFGALEWNQALQGLPFPEKLWASAFQSIATRSSGFNTVDISSLSNPTLSVILFLMFFGAAPGSCGGGVKMTTLALLIAFAWSRFRQQRRVNLFKKTIPSDTIAKAFTLIIVSIALITLIFFLLLLTAPQAAISHDDSFLVYLFETVSAFGTTGLSMGATPHLTLLGKFWIILMMLIGRVGVLTIAYIVVGTTANRGLEYAEENLMIG